MPLLSAVRTEVARYRALPGPVHVLFAVRLVNALGNFIFPFLTLYLRERMGWPRDRIGWFLTALALAMMPGAMLGGRIADSVGRRPVLLGAPLLAGLCFLACVPADGTQAVPWLLLAAAFLQSFMPPATNALVADLTTAESRPAAFAYLYLGTNLGFALGPVMAGFLFARNTALVFVGNAVAALLTVALAARWIPETKPAGQPEAARGGEATALLPLLRGAPALLAFLAVQSLFGVLYSQTGFLLTFRLNDVFGEDGPRMLGTVMTANGLVVVLCSALLVSLTRRIPGVIGVAVSAVLYGAGLAVNGWIAGPVLFVAATVVWTAGEILHVTNTNAHLANRSPPALRGRLGGAMHVFFCLGMSAGPALMGRHVETHGLSASWPVVFVIGLAAAAGMLAVWRAEARAEARAAAGAAAS